ncbi:hypothetical protein MYAM1_001844 [Malassezia yamatoensis]|uniref:AAA+ ATPase domain-containing protein n=1 Tax=Malassezia yamatoensis TaxID=253288 RepID=A0AAJ5YSS0_9BASI|nr:hypothetical protein MYAM1_001844 [Malassezia yamatoensis]
MGAFEVRQRSQSVLDRDIVLAHVKRYLSQFDALTTEQCVSLQGSDIQDDVDQIYIAESDLGTKTVQLPAQLIYHVYRQSEVDNVDEFGVGDAEDQNAADNSVAATLFELPNRSLDGVWKSLVYTNDVKSRLLHYIGTTMQFASQGIDPTVITCNRMVLLHGPPGTGKTSLCRALAQKLAIRLDSQYTHGKLVEINSHSLFSKWFSESGKLVHRLFELINELLSDQSGFVAVLIDEIESLTKARASAAAGVEPSDSIRVVNALLTELDKLKQHQNVLVMATSNLSESIDPAFLDRADIRQYIGLPGAEAIYRILRSCLEELMRVRLAQTEQLLDYNDAITSNTTSTALARLAESCYGASGRSLRRMPVLAHADHLRLHPQALVIDWINAMQSVWEAMQREAAQNSS